MRKTALLLTTAALALPSAASAAGPQPAYLGATTWTTSLDATDVGGRPSAVAYAADGTQVYALRSDGKRTVRVYVLRQSAATGALTRVAGPAGCYAAPALAGCTTLADAPAAATDVVVDPGGGTVRLVGQGVLTLARDATTGALTPLADGRGCLPAPGAPACGAPGEPLRLEVPAGGRAFALSPTRLLALAVAPSDGALAPVGCLAQGTVEGCAPAVGTGWSDDLVVSPDGRDVYAAGSADGTLTVLRARVGDDGTLTQPAGPAGLPLQRPKVCTTEAQAELEDFGGATCSPVDLLLPRDGAHLYLSGPLNIEGQRAGTRGIAFSRAATGDLTRLACPSVPSCPVLNGPVAVSADGRQLYATDLQTISEAPRDGQFVRTYQRDVDTGRLTARSFASALLQEADGDAPATRLVAGPTGRWLLTNSLEVLRRADTRPPVATVRGIPSKCARGPVTVRASVTGPRDPKRKVSVHAFEQIGFDQGPDVASREAKAAKITLRVKRVRGTELTLHVHVPGKLRNDATVERSIRFC